MENKPQDSNPIEDVAPEDIGLQEDLIESNWDESVQKFEELSLKKDLLRGIFGFGFVRITKN